MTRWLGWVYDRPKTPTQSSPPPTYNSQDTMAAAVAERKANYDAELARQRRDDKLCKEFAGFADPFCKTIQDNKHVVDAVREDLKSGVASINKYMSEKPQLDSTLPKLQDLQKQMDGFGILYNRYTLVNAVDAAGQHEMYSVFMPSKLKSFSDEIDYRELRGVTREQYLEMERQFAAFDKDGSKKLCAREFKACLYSMGEERGKKQIVEIMTRFGSGTGKDMCMTYDQYKEWMIIQLGDSDTLDEVQTGFQLINRGKQEADDELMAVVLENNDIAYIKSTHANDYKGWTAAVFAR